MRVKRRKTSKVGKIILTYRKLVKSKQGSYTITLPREWIEAQNLQPGVELVMIADENIVITPASAPDLQK